MNLIRFLDFYFTLMFFIGLYRRVGQYGQAGRLAFSGPGRWPKLLELVKHHRMIFVTWATVLPALLVFLLTLVQLTASQRIWPDATLTTSELAEMWPALVVVVPLGLVMLAVDVYCAFQVGVIDRKAMEQYFDQAEYWLLAHGSRRSHLYVWLRRSTAHGRCRSTQGTAGCQPITASEFVVVHHADRLARCVRPVVMDHVDGDAQLSTQRQQV